MNRAMNRRTKETQSNAGINTALQGGGRPKVKSFGQKSWMLPQPVLIIGTYDKNGKPDMEKMELIVFDPIHHGYIELGKTIGKAFSDGKALK